MTPKKLAVTSKKWRSPPVKSTWMKRNQHIYPVTPSPLIGSRGVLTGINHLTLYVVHACHQIRLLRHQKDPEAEWKTEWHTSRWNKASAEWVFPQPTTEIIYRQKKYDVKTKMSAIGNINDISWQGLLETKRYFEHIYDIMSTKSY